ncbi:hypothetical protein HOLleu_37856 [Holothuria leucospilota]|uniref:Uncharacterized protein n=1 Tax=Holothuria leucospilota TaxID=206669 RepID=A0A9Q1BEU1_HOLLE|nr:hypothetical protein HOLleu_37856 [Holothuria leucospilota]
MGYNDDVFQTIEVDSGRIISALERQVSNIQTSDGNFTNILQNVGVSAVKINPNSVKISLNFANNFPENRTVILGSNIRDGETQVFENEADVPLMHTVSSISIQSNVFGSLTKGMGGHNNKVVLQKLILF